MCIVVVHDGVLSRCSHCCVRNQFATFFNLSFQYDKIRRNICHCKKRSITNYKVTHPNDLASTVTIDLKKRGVA